jgi:hypothetical protein
MNDDQNPIVKLSAPESKVFKANRTLMQMLKDRGYGVSDQLIDMTRD